MREFHEVVVCVGLSHVVAQLQGVPSSENSLEPWETPVLHRTQNEDVWAGGSGEELRGRREH